MSCNCKDTYPEVNATDCSAAEGDAANRRVLVLAVGGVIRTKGRQLRGPISSALANLTELRTLDLHDNRLSVRMQSRLLMSLRMVHKGCLCTRA